MKYEIINPNKSYSAGDKFHNAYNRNDYVLVYIREWLCLLNVKTFVVWDATGVVGTSASLMDLSPLFKYSSDKDLSQLAQWTYVDSAGNHIPLVREAVEYLRIVEFVYDKNPGYHYGAGDAPEWRRVGITEESDVYIKGFDFNRNDRRTFRKDRIVGGRIIEVKE